AGDMTVTVEAGCTLAALAKTLATSGQWLPLDPPWPEATTIGGLVAANLSGPLRASQGRVRDLLLGIRVVGADGALVSGGGRVVGLAGIAEEVAHARARTLELAKARGLHAITVADGAALRARLADFALEPAEAVLRAAMLPTEVGAFIARASRSGAALRCLGHAASGVVRVAVPEARAVAGLVATLRPGLEARGGSLVVERATPEVKAQVDVWGDPGE